MDGLFLDLWIYLQSDIPNTTAVTQDLDKKDDFSRLHFVLTWVSVVLIRWSMSKPSFLNCEL